MCFELLGFDVMLNDKAEPIIIEINHTPSFTTDTPLDHFIKFNYIKDALTIMNINDKTKTEIIRQQKEACQLRVMTGKKVKLSLEERELKKKDLIEKKLKYEGKNIGKFERIYPL
jgi:tubulin polyglutamylase TTLL6/13